MLIGSHQRITSYYNQTEMTISIDDNELKRVSSAKTLGIIIDENIKWTKQIDSTSKKISKSIGILKRLKPFCS